MYENKDRGFRDEEDEESIGSIEADDEEGLGEEDTDEKNW